MRRRVINADDFRPFLDVRDISRRQPLLKLGVNVSAIWLETVVAVVTTLITRTMSFMSNVIRISTAWQSPNVVAIPIQVLKDFSWSE